MANQNKGNNDNRGGNKNTNPGNFANDREKAAEAGRKGGQQSQGGRGQDNNQSR